MPLALRGPRRPAQRINARYPFMSAPKATMIFNQLPPKGVRMIRPIVTSSVLPRMPSAEAPPADAPIGQDLLDTLAAHAHECVGMAANMIGQFKRVIVVQDGSRTRLMHNPRITARTGEYQTDEGCLSLTGTRPATRYRRIVVSYLDQNFRQRLETFSGYTAQIIQHETDHCNGIVI